ncbi:MAG: SDR family oxidoreductase [Proteobacteria bacterium]|nr:SDR family oxidoreductase [Pseudomonadota bacterium]
MPKYNFSGQVAIITGGARGIGLAIVKRLLEGGARVAVWDRDGEAIRELVTALPAAELSAHQVDICDYAQVEKALEQTVKQHGSVSILVNNAGIAGPSVPLWEYPVEAWAEVIDIDLQGVFHVCRAVIPLMREAGAGHVVNVSSVAGKEGNPTMSAYSAAKAGVIGLTKSLGKELARDGIFVNCITPATADTDILKQFSEAQMQANLAKVPMGRVVATDEVAALVVWLCSEDCSFSTGATFDISGGRCTY